MYPSGAWGEIYIVMSDVKPQRHHCVVRNIKKSGKLISRDKRMWVEHTLQDRFHRESTLITFFEKGTLGNSRDMQRNVPP